MDTNQCVYCTRQAYAKNATKPPLCQKHLDLVLLAGQARRMGLVITISNLQRVFRETVHEIRVKISFNPVDIPGLVREMQDSGHPLPETWFQKGEEHHGHR